MALAVESVLGAFVGLLDDNGFSAGVFTSSNDDYSSGFDKSSHVMVFKFLKIKKKYSKVGVFPLF